MAKKKNKVEVSLAPIKVDNLNVTSNIKIDKNDLISVAVARKERELLVEKEMLTKNLKKLGADRKQKESELEQAKEDAVVSHFTKKVITTLQTALSAVNSDIKLQTRYSDRFYDESREYCNNTSKLMGTLCFVTKERGGAGIIKESVFDKPDSVFSVEKELNVLVENTTNTQNQLCKVNEGLSNLSRLERQIRAKFAENVLGQTKEGKALLESLGSEEDFTKLLG